METIAIVESAMRTAQIVAVVGSVMSALVAVGVGLTYYRRRERKEEGK